jgi:hypothetical protein
MKRWALLLGVIGMAAWTATGCAPAADESGKGFVVLPDSGTAKDMEVEKKLQASLASVAFDDTELGAIMDWLRQTTKLDIHMKWNVLETAGITPSTKEKSIHLNDVTVAAALRAVLDDVGAQTPLGFVVQDGFLVVSTKDDLSGPRYRKTVIYDIRDIVPVGEAKVIILRVNDKGVLAGEDLGNPRVAAFEGLCRIIARVVDKDSWMDPYGTGTVASMSEYGGLLIIEQTWENHRKIAALLADIRRHKPTFN